MNFSTIVKNELVSERVKSPCCRRACLSAFLRTAGSVETSGGTLGFSAVSDEATLLFFQSIIKSLYGGEPKIISEKQKERKKLVFFGEQALNALVDCEIVRVESGGLELSLNVSKYVVENDCCKRAFVKGAFLGAGSVTVPSLDQAKKTGYHLEFEFSKYATATDFADILCAEGFAPKQVERKDFFVVYFKSSEEIGDALTLMGATSSYLKLVDVVMKKDVANNANRAVNCEMSNVTKQVNASIKLREDIAEIERTIGLEALDEPLRRVAEARLEYPEASLSELAERLSLGKSCLCHRLNKIKKIADEL